MENDELDLKIQEFITYRIANGDSISTAERRARRVKTLSKQFNVWKIDLKKIYEYLEKRERKGIKKKSLRLEMMDLEHWFSFLGYDVTLPRLKKEPDPEPFIPTPEQIKAIRNYCLSKKDKYTWMRNLVMIDILYTTGVRAGELINLNVEDFKGDSIYVRSEKGEKDRTIPLPDEVAKEIKDYISNYRYKSDPKALFTTRVGRFNYTKLRDMVKKIGMNIGIPELHPHSFRHYYATMLVRLGVDIRRVQILVGHARIDTTTRYTHLTQKEVGEEVKSKVEQLFSFREKIEPEVQKQLGATPEGMGALGFEPRSAGLS